MADHDAADNNTKQVASLFFLVETMHFAPHGQAAQRTRRQSFIESSVLMSREGQNWGHTSVIRLLILIRRFTHAWHPIHLIHHLFQGHLQVHHFRIIIVRQAQLSI